MRKPRHSLNRRGFLAAAAASTAGIAMAGENIVSSTIMTLQGPIAPEALGTTLPHEHIMVDFIGAAEATRDRYDADEVFRVVLPHVEALKAAGAKTLVECTPAYIARDAALLKRISKATGMHLLTNTGYYGAAGDKFVPAHAYEETADQLAARWIREWAEGIDGTGIRPGFIKTAVDGAPLSEIDAKLVRAAARTHLKTGLTIASHTTDGAAIQEERQVLEEEGVDPSALIWVHASAVPDPSLHAAMARAGMWVEFDGLNPDSLEAHVAMVAHMKAEGLLGHVLVSHDAGWYSVGEPGGGDFRGFTLFFEKFIPALKAGGFTEAEIDQIAVKNPARAFTIGVRRG